MSNMGLETRSEGHGPQARPDQGRGQVRPGEDDRDRGQPRRRTVRAHDLSRECPTGDGILTSLRMLEVLARGTGPCRAWSQGFANSPRSCSTSPSPGKPISRGPRGRRGDRRVPGALEGRGRLEVRYSGTEPLARVMVEGEDLREVQGCARRIADAIAENLG